MHPAVRNWINQRTTDFNDPQNRAARHYGFRERMGVEEENRLYNFFRGKGPIPKSLQRLDKAVRVLKRAKAVAPVVAYGIGGGVNNLFRYKAIKGKVNHYAYTHGGKRPMIDPNQPPTSGNKRGGGTPEGGAAYKRPRTAPTDADDTLPVGPYDPGFPDDDPFDDPGDDDPKGGRGGGGRPDWSGNPGTHTARAPPQRIPRLLHS